MNAAADTTAIRPLGPENRHFWLVQRMAKAAGIDLVTAMREHELTQEDWARIINRCRGCPSTDGCARWLAQAGSGPQDVPADCVNRDRFKNLKAALMELES